MNRNDWMASALCRQADPDLFTPDAYRGQPVRDAKAVCNRCPSRKPCLDDALTTEAGQSRQMRESIRGGLTPGERYDLEQQQAA